MSVFPAHRFERIARLANIDAVGPFDRGGVKLRWDDTPRRTTDALESLIDDTWVRERALADQSGAVLFNGDLIRLVDHELVRNELLIDVGPTDYKSFLGTNLRNSHLIEDVGRDAFANAIGVSALIVCGDDPATVLLGHRSAKVVDQPGTIHTFGGALDASDRDRDGNIDVYAAVMREICEELAIAAGEVVGLECLGLVCDRTIWQPELVFEARVKMCVDEVVSRVDISSESAEHIGVETIVDLPADVASYVITSAGTTPVACSALCLHGWRKFGPQWCEDLLEQLS